MSGVLVRKIYIAAEAPWLLQYVDDVRNQCSQNYFGVGAYWHKDELTAVLAKSDFPSDVQAALRDMAEFFNFTL